MLKDLGAIALFLGVVLNAYHYYKLHSWSKKDKNFEMILKIVNDLKDIRDKILDAKITERKLTNQISYFSHSLDDGKPSDELCYELFIFEEKIIKLYKDYTFIIKFKKALQIKNIVDINLTEEFILDIQIENENILHNMFTMFCQWENIMKSHNKNAYIGTMETFTNCENIDELFKLSK